MIGLTTDIVELQPYTSEWKDEFNKEKEFLLNILSGYDVMIEYVGSTSIDGCPAKPVIDVFIGVESLEYAEHLIPVFVEHGYIFKINVPNEVYFKKRNNNLTTHHIHIADINGEVWNSQILFRNYMGSHPEKLQEYIALKSKRAAQFPKDRDSYAKGKKEFIETMIFEAQNEIIRKRNKE